MEELHEYCEGGHGATRVLILQHVFPYLKPFANLGGIIDERGYSLWRNRVDQLLVEYFAEGDHGDNRGDEVVDQMKWGGHEPS